MTVLRLDELMKYYLNDSLPRMKNCSATWYQSMAFEIIHMRVQLFTTKQIRNTSVIERCGMIIKRSVNSRGGVAHDLAHSV